MCEVEEKTGILKYFEKSAAIENCLSSQIYLKTGSDTEVYLPTAQRMINSYKPYSLLWDQNSWHRILLGTKNNSRKNLGLVHYKERLATSEGPTQTHLQRVQQAKPPEGLEQNQTQFLPLAIYYKCLQPLGQFHKICKQTAACLNEQDLEPWR